MSNYKTFNDLPVSLSAEQVSQILGISRASVYNLMRRKDFPLIRIGNRKIVMKDMFISWLKDQENNANG